MNLPTREMRAAFVLSLCLLCWGLVAPAAAQQPESSSSLQRVRVSLQNPPNQTWLANPVWDDSSPRRIGILTLVAPQKRGEIVRVSLPVGELATRAVRGVAAASRRRAERKAREDVQRELRQFEAKR
jgi:hypothetical protein